MLGIDPAVAVKVVAAVPAGTVIDPGTGSSLVLLDRATVAPPADANWLRETVQTVAPPLLSEVGVHEIPVNVGNGTVMVPPVPVTETGLPAAAAPAKFVSPIEELSAEVVIVTVITATTPLCISVSFMPDNRHV